ALVLEVEQMHNQLAEAEAALKEAELTVKETAGQVRTVTSNWERKQALFTEGIVPAGERDQAQDALSQVQARYSATQERVAQLKVRLNNALTAQKRIQLRERKVQTLEAEVQKAQASVRLVQTEVERSAIRQDKLQILEARLKEARAKVERVRQSLQDTILRSPIDGVISRKRTEEGQVVQNGQPVLVISDPKDVWILANIKESYIRDVVVGKTVDITVDAYPEQRLVEQRIPVQIAVANTAGRLKPGMMVVVGIVKD
ncbi:MAG: HlyD family secretion protein, partial [Dehalococcoidia bacterium]|nr:HlyD family secretion protein [Dehalococcoidia bacterium]